MKQTHFSHQFFPTTSFFLEKRRVFNFPARAKLDLGVDKNIDIKNVVEGADKDQIDLAEKLAKQLPADKVKEIIQTGLSFLDTNKDKKVDKDKFDFFVKKLEEAIDSNLKSYKIPEEYKFVRKNSEIRKNKEKYFKQNLDVTRALIHNESSLFKDKPFKISETETITLSKESSAADIQKVLRSKKLDIGSTDIDERIGEKTIESMEELIRILKRGEVEKAKSAKEGSEITKEIFETTKAANMAVSAVMGQSDNGIYKYSGEFSMKDGALVFSHESFADPRIIKFDGSDKFFAKIKGDKNKTADFLAKVKEAHKKAIAKAISTESKTIVEEYKTGTFDGNATGIYWQKDKNSPSELVSDGKLAISSLSGKEMKALAQKLNNERTKTNEFEKNQTKAISEINAEKNKYNLSNGEFTLKKGYLHFKYKDGDKVKLVKIDAKAEYIASLKKEERKAFVDVLNGKKGKAEVIGSNKYTPTKIWKNNRWIDSTLDKDQKVENLRISKAIILKAESSDFWKGTRKEALNDDSFRIENNGLTGVTSGLFADNYLNMEKTLNISDEWNKLPLSGKYDIKDQLIKKWKKKTA
jgi:hypothetical protein